MKHISLDALSTPVKKIRDKKTVEIVVPVYNEQDNIEHFTEAVERAMDGLSYPYRILFVDDGSSDRSAAVLQQLMEKDVHVRALFLSRNYGHQIALTCGLDHADADAVITMDGDMQHPPALIPELLARWEDGFQVVQTIRLTTEGVSPLKRASSALYYKLFNWMSDVPIYPGGSDFRLMDHEVVVAFRRYRESHRFIRGIIENLGFRQTQISFTAPPRYAGKSKFTLPKMRQFALDGLLGFSSAPLRLAFLFGGLSFFLSVLCLADELYTVLSGQGFTSLAITLFALFLLGGTQFTLIGILGEYVGRIFRQVQNRPLYLLQQDPFDEQAKSRHTSSKESSSVAHAMDSDRKGGKNDKEEMHEKAAYEEIAS